MDCATIFIRDTEWIKESESGVLDVRFDTQCLPAGCWVACFIVRTPDGIRMVENIPHLSDEWYRHYQNMKKYALAVIETGWAEEPDFSSN